MSLHVSEINCSSNDDGRIVWVAACSCGWTSDEYDGGNHALARRAYREHVEEVLGVDAYYQAPVSCRNCSSEHTQGVLMGTQVTSENCTHCGVSMLSPNNDAWHEMKRRYII